MSEPVKTPENQDHTRAVLLAVTVMVMTCILATAAVLITLILQIP